MPKTQKTIRKSTKEAQKIISDGQIQAETLKKEKQLEAKENFVQLKAEHDKDVMQRNQKLTDAENRIKAKRTIHQSKRSEC